jgi:hypothetical protein
MDCYTSFPSFHKEKCIYLFNNTSFCFYVESNKVMTVSDEVEKNVGRSSQVMPKHFMRD